MVTSTIIVDTSVIIKWLSQDNEDFIKEADNLLRDAQNEKTVIIAPELAKYEVGNVLRFSKHLSSTQAKTVLSKFYILPLSFIAESEELAHETYQLAFDLRITYYDASFISLAKQYNAILVTENVKHQGKLTQVKVKTLRDY